jgi:hypothetical protein
MVRDLDTGMIFHWWPLMGHELMNAAGGQELAAVTAGLGEE